MSIEDLSSSQIQEDKYSFMKTRGKDGATTLRQDSGPIAMRQSISSNFVPNLSVVNHDMLLLSTEFEIGS